MSERSRAITAEAFADLVRPLSAMKVSLPWKGIGSAIFLELGELAGLQPGRRRNRGEACIFLEWDWRVEHGGVVLFGSSNSRPEIEKGIAILEGTTVQQISVGGAVPEIVVGFSNGHFLRSMVMVSGDPQWNIRLPNGTWISCEEGRLTAGDGSGSGTTAEEAAMFDRAESIARRWGTPVAEPIVGACKNCKWFVPLDGDGSLLDFGACANGASPFDGRVVSSDSGCPAFSAGYPL